METYTINKTLLVNAKPYTVFKALTDSEQIVQYYPLQKVVSDWQLGSEVHYHGEVNEQPFTDYGVIEAIKPPIEYRYRYWSDNHGTERLPENHLVISYRLEAQDGSTLIHLEQSNIQSKEMYNLMDESVWSFLLGSLKAYVEAKS
ncbi:SRPBCC family protein [Aliivibrio kagoshimensis]|uniref:SRPBCC family protein n=1 Tax=Aliivibrio kagoshimensis TaxID=2910230 RepID=UPI003D0B8884